MTDPKYRGQQLNYYHLPDEKVAAKISKAYKGDCLGYHKTNWGVYVGVVRIEGIPSFFWMDEHYITNSEYNSWGAQIVDKYFTHPKWDLYFEHVWCWDGVEVINEWFDYVESVEAKAETGPPKDAVTKKIDPTSKVVSKPRVKKSGMDSQMDLFEFVS